MREKLVAHDVVECVLGLGPNLFYNSPMEACIVICRMNKPKARRKKVLFINAINEVTRERAQSFLTDDHIAHIADAYRSFGGSDGFASVVSLAEVRANDNNLSIPLYVREKRPAMVREDGVAYGEKTLAVTIDEWQESSAALQTSMNELFKTLEKTSAASEEGKSND